MSKVVISILVFCIGYVSFPTMTFAETAAESDFYSRCNGPGKVMCFDFDDEAKLENYLELPTGKVAVAKMDTEYTASGSGSLKFTIPSRSAGDALGSFAINFADDFSKQFGEGEEFYVQWRQSFSPEMLSTDFGGDGFKQIIIGEGDRENHWAPGCSEIEVVMYDSYFRGFPQAYHSCWNWVELQEKTSPPIGTDYEYDYKLQNAISDPYCLWSNNPEGQLTGKTPCFFYKPNQWMTFEVHIKIGHWNEDDSRIQMWAADENGSPVLLIDMENFTLINENQPDSAKYGKVHLTPYMTNKNRSQKNPEAYTWYDELIVSTSEIPFPSKASSVQNDTPLDSKPVHKVHTTTRSKNFNSGGFHRTDENGPKVNNKNNDIGGLQWLLYLFLFEFAN